MDIFSPILDWASRPETSNATRTFVALLAVPGALWGFWLFSRWVRGRGLDQRVEQLLDQNGELGARVDQLLAQNRELASQNATMTKTVEGLATQLAARLVSQADATPAGSVLDEKRAEDFGQAVAELAQRTDQSSQHILGLLSSGNIAAAHSEFTSLMAEKAKRGEALNKEDADIARKIANVLEDTNVAEAAKLLAKAAEGDAETAWSWIQAGDKARDAGQESDALAAYERARILAEQHGDDSMLATAHGDIAIIHDGRHELAEGVRHRQLQVDALRRLRSAKNNVRTTERMLDALRFLARALLALQDHASNRSAAACASEAADLAEKLAAADPSNVSSRANVEYAYFELHGLLERVGDVDGALAAARRRLEVASRLASEFPENRRYREDCEQAQRAIDRLSRAKETQGEAGQATSQDFAATAQHA
jgi:tetratricopeptide (TPR) repeat protein